MQFEQLIYVCHDAARCKGFWEEPTAIGTRLMLVVSELGEAMEAVRTDAFDQHLPERKGLEVELADAVIRICDIAGGLDLDLQGAVLEKLIYNQSRPHKHGKAF